MRTKVIAVLAVVIALVGSAGVAQAAEPYDLSVSVDRATVFPVVDGYQDSVPIEGVVDAGSVTRIRGAVVITVGARIVKTVLLDKSGPFSFIWNGKTAAGVIVSGTATVTLRVDGQTPVSDSLTVSEKKLVQATATRVQGGAALVNCRDDRWLTSGPVPEKWFHEICLIHDEWDGYGSVNLTVRGRKSVGPVQYFGINWYSIPSQVRSQVYGPTKMRVTGTFVQSGAGSNQLFVCVTEACSIPTHSTTFSKSGTYTTTETLSATPPHDLSWSLVVQHGHDVRIKKWTITYTYWVLK